MKRARKFAAATGLLAVWLGSALIGEGGIEGSRHDFTIDEDSRTHSCNACHVPHLKAGPRPRWEPAQRAGEVFKPYKLRREGPGSTTLVCLGCHDGTVAGDVSAGRHRTFPVSQFGGSLQIVGRGSGHPVGVRYPEFDEKYQPRVAVEKVGRIKLPDRRVECISCHDPHDAGRHEKMLVVSNRRSGLCLACHRI